MANSILRPGERLDDLLINGFKIIQHSQEFCFSLDAILLAHFATVRPKARVVDLGSGTGVLGMLLLARQAGMITGIEINQAMADMSTRSFALNGLSDKATILNADISEIKSLLPSGAYDLVISNPPYRVAGGGYVSPNSKVAVARHESSASLDDFIAAASFLVKYRGRFAMVHLPERMAEILKSMSEHELEPKRLRLVYPAADKKPKFLLVEGVRGGKPGLDVLPPLFVYNFSGEYSSEIRGYYSEDLPRDGE